jgi:hypothetical protein
VDFDDYAYAPALGGILPGTTTQADAATPGVAGSTGTTLGTGTGRFGIQPVMGLIGGGMSGAIEEVWDWVNQPFTTPMNPGTVFILVGIVLVAVVVWNLVLFHIRIAAETI